jgi:hypothetical protein
MGKGFIYGWSSQHAPIAASRARSAFSHNLFFFWKEKLLSRVAARGIIFFVA